MTAKMHVYPVDWYHYYTNNPLGKGDTPGKGRARTLAWACQQTVWMYDDICRYEAWGGLSRRISSWTFVPYQWTPGDPDDRLTIIGEVVVGDTVVGSIRLIRGNIE